MHIRQLLFVIMAAMASLLWASGSWAGGEVATQFPNNDGISSTRHNLTQSTMTNNQGSQMNAYRNDYGAVCVYCHTPHGANTNIDAPLWNRTYKANTYTTYDTLNTSTLTQPVTAPGVNSMTCLSCHDGTIATDSIINMPGSGQYEAARATQAANTPFDSSLLSGAFAFVPGPGQSASGDHYSMNAGTTFGDKSCLACHNPSGPADAADFSVFVIGQDLTNDHPVGITLPVARVGVDFKGPTHSINGLEFYDTGTANNRADPNEVRFYNTGGGPEVECASCHDPHGVDGGGGNIIGSFLRVANTGSALCQTCHSM